MTELSSEDRMRAFRVLALHQFFGQAVSNEELDAKIEALREAYEGIPLYEIPPLPKTSGVKRALSKNSHKRRQAQRKRQRQARRRNR